MGFLRSEYGLEKQRDYTVKMSVRGALATWFFRPMRAVKIDPVATAPVTDYSALVAHRLAQSYNSSRIEN
jgi:hypothetical protein